MKTEQNDAGRIVFQVNVFFLECEMVRADKVLLVNAHVDDVLQSCCNKPNICLTNGGKRFDGRRIPMIPFPICNVAVLSSLHYGKPEKQHLLKHLCHELLQTSTHFPSAVISIQVWGATCPSWKNCFLKTKTLQMYQDLPYFVRKMCAIPPDRSTVMERPLPTGRLSQSSLKSTL